MYKTLLKTTTLLALAIAFTVATARAALVELTNNPATPGIQIALQFSDPATIAAADLRGLQALLVDGTDLIALGEAAAFGLPATPPPSNLLLAIMPPDTSQVMQLSLDLSAFQVSGNQLKLSAAGVALPPGVSNPSLLALTGPLVFTFEVSVDPTALTATGRLTDVSASAVPEPTTWMLAGAGLLACFLRKRR